MRFFPQSTTTYAMKGYNRRSRKTDLSSPHLSPSSANWCWLAQWTKYIHIPKRDSVLWGVHLHVSNIVLETRTELSTSCHWLHSVPLEQLQVLFTFFSKFFSPFVHTTSSLSVSQEYLALDEIYHLFRAAIPNNPTREKLDTYWNIRRDAYGVLTLFDALFQRTYSHNLQFRD